MSMRSARAVRVNAAPVAQREDDLASALDQDALDRAAVPALEVEDEVDRFLDVGPVHAFECGVVEQRRKARAGQADKVRARVRRQRPGRVALGEILQRAVPGLAGFARPEFAFDRILSVWSLRMRSA